MSHSGDTEPVTPEERPDPRLHHERLALRVLLDGALATHPLPSDGKLTIGRASGADLRIDHPSVSRRHAELRVGPVVWIEDVGSANGTRVGERVLRSGEAIELAIDQPVQIGSALLVLQHGVSAGRPRRIWSHGFFEARLEEECARAERTGQTFAVMRVAGDPGVNLRVLEERVSRLLRAGDVVAQYGPGELEAILPAIAPTDAAAVRDKIAVELATAGLPARLGLSSFPREGRTPEELVAVAGRQAHPPATADGPGEVRLGGAMARLAPLIERVAQGNITVLLLGETGVGKEVLAGVIHRTSPRSARPFVAINCASLSEALLESELFGFERGAFTGASQAKLGLIESADGGTVFLDEIGELPLSLQAKLLRVLQEHTVQRIGALRPRPVSVRFVAATNRDLEAEVARGHFRADLFFRLNAVSLVIPPLRERRDEIPTLTTSFLREAAALYGRVPPAMSEQAATLLLGYPWPGNLRELRNVLERAVLLCTGPRIEPEHLPVDKLTQDVVVPAFAPATPPAQASPAWASDRNLTGPPPTGPADSPQPALRTPDETGLRSQVRELERQRIVDALGRCAGNQSQAARLLGISRQTLIARIEAFGLPRPRKA